MFDSWVFTGVMVVTVVFQVIIVEFLGAFASTVPLSWQHWLLSILIGSLSMIVAVILKCIPVESSHQHHDGYDLLPSGPSSSNSAWYHFNVFCLLSGQWFQICKILQILVFFLPRIQFCVFTKSSTPTCGSLSVFLSLLFLGNNWDSLRS